MMNEKLQILCFSAQCKILPNVWYKVTNISPHLSRNVSCIMALIMGSQPKGMQHNFEMSSCHLCDLHENDTPTHVLFKCKAHMIQQARDNQWSNILSVMPPAMATQVITLNDDDKTRFILTGLSGGYVAEWLPVYSSISMYVYKLYSLRDKLYRDMEATT